MNKSTELQALLNYHKNEIWASTPSKTDFPTEYWYQIVNSVDLTEEPIKNTDNRQIGIVGYACDSGVQRNNGRVGAAQGPQAIRESLAKLAFHLDEDKEVYDFGDLMCADGNMESTQAELSKVISNLSSNNIAPIVLGGGHDIAYGHFAGLHNALPDADIGIINFDAHLDLRPPEPHGNSGTPFTQIYQLLRENDKVFNYMPIGIQQYSNSKSLFAKAEEVSADVIFLDEISPHTTDRIADKLERFIASNDYIYITIDLDGISSAYAPGVSAPSPMGIDPQWLYNILNTIFKSGKVLSCDIAEMNPQYDRDNQTAKLAAELITRIAQLY